MLTNYETTWYPSGYTAYELVHNKGAIGPIRKIVVRAGHFGPKELDVPPSFSPGSLIRNRTAVAH